MTVRVPAGLLRDVDGVAGDLKVERVGAGGPTERADETRLLAMSITVELPPGLSNGGVDRFGVRPHCHVEGAFADGHLSRPAGAGINGQDACCDLVGDVGTGFSMTPPTTRTWARRGRTPGHSGARTRPAPVLDRRSGLLQAGRTRTSDPPAQTARRSQRGRQTQFHRDLMTGIYSSPPASGSAPRWRSSGTVRVVSRRTTAWLGLDDSASESRSATVVRRVCRPGEGTCLHRGFLWASSQSYCPYR